MTKPVIIPAVQLLVDELVEFAQSLDGGMVARQNHLQIGEQARSLSNRLSESERELAQGLPAGDTVQYFSVETIEFAFICQDYQAEQEVLVAPTLIRLALEQLGVHPETPELPDGAAKCLFCDNQAVTADGQCTACRYTTMGRELRAFREFM